MIQQIRHHMVSTIISLKQTIRLSVWLFFIVAGNTKRLVPQNKKYLCLRKATIMSSRHNTVRGDWCRQALRNRVSTSYHIHQAFCCWDFVLGRLLGKFIKRYSFGDMLLYCAYRSKVKLYDVYVGGKGDVFLKQVLLSGHI